MADLNRNNSMAHKRFLYALLTSSVLIFPSIDTTLTVIPAPAGLGAITRISIASDGTQADDFSWAPSVSSDGRYIAYQSAATNLAPGDGNSGENIFVYDRQTGQVELVSVATDGAQGNNSSVSPAISADGRYVVFLSAADNLVPNDTNGMADTFVHDRQTGKTTRISVASDGAQCDDGSFDTSPAISTDGRYVTFCSYASNLVPAGDINGAANPDVYLHDRHTKQTTRISVASDGSQANDWSCHPSMSADGRYVAFDSWASNLSDDDTDVDIDIFVHDRLTGQTELVSRSAGGEPGNSDSQSPSISADGRYVSFVSGADNLVEGDANQAWDIFVHDRLTGQNRIASLASDGRQGNDGSIHAVISGDGRFVFFDSIASNLVEGDSNDQMDLFVRNLETGETLRASTTADGKEGNDNSRFPTISNDGCAMAFASNASNLVPGDTNNVQDIFVRIQECKWHLYIPLLRN